MLLATPPSLSTPIPLVLDLDGTLIHTDTFHEMMVYLLIKKPLILLRVPYWLFKGRAYAKAQIVEHADLNLETLPYNKELLSFAQQEGRPLILATGTDQRLAQKISDHLGIFLDVIGSNGTINMTGHQKGKVLCDRFGTQGFDYAGDSSVDTFVWQVSRKALVVSPKWGVLKKVRVLKGLEHIHCIPREHGRIVTFLLALRPLFWIANLLTSSVSLWVGLSLLSSGLLIFNDLFLIEKERKELCKKKSVFAEGRLYLITAFIMVPLFIFSSLFFLLSLSQRDFYLLIYIPLLIGLDRITRPTPQLLRWTALGLFQALIAVTIGFKSMSILLPQ